MRNAVSRFRIASIRRGRSAASSRGIPLAILRGLVRPLRLPRLRLGDVLPLRVLVRQNRLDPLDEGSQGVSRIVGRGPGQKAILLLGQRLGGEAVIDPEILEAVEAQ